MSNEQLTPSFIEEMGDISLRLAVGQLIADKIIAASEQQDATAKPDNNIETDETSALQLNLAIEKVLHKAAQHNYIEQEKIATTDPLTGLPNRRSLIDRFDRQVWADYERKTYGGKSAVAGSMLFIDIDNFGDFNTNNGHEGGDLVLKSLAGSVGKHIRPTDIFGRLAGDEFVVIFLGLSEEDSKKVADKLVEAVRSETTATFSGGVAEINSSNFAENLGRADHALYLAKHKGRNQAATYNEYQEHQQKESAGEEVNIQLNIF